MIGTLAAIGLGLAGAGTAVAGIAGANAQKNAAKTAAAATTQAADQSAAVIERNYDKSAQALAPWQQQGLAANAMINAALGLSPTPTTNVSYQPQPNALMPSDYGVNDYGNLSPDGSGNWTYGQGTNPADTTGYGAMSATGTVNTPAPNPASALDTYLNSTGYRFQLGEGLKAVNSGWAGRGLLQSGAALKSLNNYAQGQAQQGFGQWLGALGNQQGLGASAASAQAGVSQNLGNSLADIYTNRGENLANAAIAGANSGTAGALGNALAMMGGGLFKYGK